MSEPHEALAQYFDDAVGLGGSADHDALWEAVRDASQGGKHLRPLLFMSVYEALGGTEEATAAQVAAALELMHTAFVVHDDVIDGEEVRRGRANVSGTFAAQARAAGVDAERATRYGAAAGILAGDLALAGAVRLVALCGASPARVRRMLDLLDHALHVSAAGELADVRMSLDGRVGGVDEALEMTDAKTAAYSFALPLQLAGLLAGASERDLAVLGRFGRLLGVAFQLRDDVHGLFGDPTRTGKSSVSDLREGKCTPLIAYARTTAAWPEIAPHLGSADIDEPAARRVRDLLLACGARRYVEEQAMALAEQASALVAHLDVAPVLQTWVVAVTRDLRHAA